LEAKADKVSTDARFSKDVEHEGAKKKEPKIDSASDLSVFGRFHLFPRISGSQLCPK
jgi:hypothetical protein